jgi:hypothetical protein
LLDGLRAEDKRVVAGEKFNWYRLTELLNDAAGKPLDGWVCETVGVTPWVSPWHWDGYAIIHDYGPLPDGLASSLNLRGLLADADVERLRPRIDRWDQGPVQSRLYDIIDGNRDGKLAADEIQTALGIPAKAQSIAQLVIEYESEWHYRQAKWDDLDEVLGHTSSTPLLNWMAEKQRILELKWWSDVAGRIGLPEGGRVYHLHPVGFITMFGKSPIETLIRKIGDLISHGEGGYESYNTGTKNTPDGKVGYSFYSPPVGTVTNKTINEIISTDSLSGTDSSRMFATGKYQTVIATLRDAKAALSLAGTEKYTAELQERVFAEFLFKKAGGGRLNGFVRNGSGSVDDAQYAAAKEWASIAAPAGRTVSDGRVSDGNLSYYAGAANSASSESTVALRQMLIEIDQSR